MFPFNIVTIAAVVIYVFVLIFEGAPGGAVGWVNALQVGR